MPTEVFSYIRASGGDYTTLSAWEAGEQRDLVTADQIETAVCYNDWPSGLSDRVTVSGFTTDATRFVRITVAEGHRHDGTPGSGFYIQTALTGQVVRFNDANCEGLWLHVKTTSTATDSRPIYGSGANTKIINCIGERSYLDSGATRNTIDLIGANSLCRSSLSIGGYYGIKVSGTGGRIENCAAVGAHFGFARNANANVKNCVAYGNAIDDFENVGSYGGNSSNNASEDATATNASTLGGAVTGVTSAAFVNAASNDFHLSAGSVLRGAGVNLYSDLTTDIDGEAWPSSGAWDIGFDYYVAAGGGVTFSSITASNVTSTSATLTIGGITR